MKRILMIGINARYSHSNLALHYLRQYIDSPEYHIDIKEYSIKENLSKILCDIKGSCADVLVLSVYIWNSIIVKQLLKDLSDSLADTPRVILGGPEVSYTPQAWIDNFSAIDYIIAGPGEESLKRILDSMDSASMDKIVRYPNPPFDEIPFPYIDNDFEKFSHRIVYYESSRGCAFNCSYCLSSRRDQKTEFKSSEKVFHELDQICRHNIRTLKFVDRTFNCPRGRALQIWKYIAEKYSGRGIVFHFEVHPELLDEEDIEYLSSVQDGLFQFEIGIQSMNLRTLKEINRLFNLEKVITNALRVCLIGSIHCHVDIIAGLPFEDLESYIYSFNMVHGLGADHFQPGILKILPGTEMYDRASEYGMEWSTEPPYEVMCNKWIGMEDFAMVKGVSKITELIFNSGKFSTALNFMLEKAGSPWELYKTLWLDYFRKADFIRDFDSVGMLLMKYMEDRVERRDFEYFIDLLAMDWVRISKKCHFPEALKKHIRENARKTGYRYFIEKSSNNMIEADGIFFTSTMLKKSIFYIPLSDRFRNEQGVEYGVVFLTSGEKLLFPEEVH